MMKILIADDQPEVRSAIRLILEQQQGIYNIEEVADANKLLEWLSSNKAYMLLLDWELPGMEIEELIPELRSLYQNMFIIVLNTQPRTRQLAIAAGANDFIGKNEPPERFMEVIGKYRTPFNNSSSEKKTGGKEYRFKNITGVKISGSFKAEIIKSELNSEVSVMVEDPDSTAIDIDGDTLKISYKRFNWIFPFHRQPEVKITIPDLNQVALSGASSGKLLNFKSSHNLYIDLTGASRLEALDIAADNIQIKAHGASIFSGNLNVKDEMKLDVVGAGKVEMEGSSKRMVLTAMGASKVQLEHFHTGDAYVKLMGASRSTINVDGKLDATLAGASNLSWTGSPVMGDIEIIGASSLRRK